MWQVVGILFLSPTHTHTHTTCMHCPDPQRWLSAVVVRETEVWEMHIHAESLALRSHLSHKPCGFYLSKMYMYIYIFF